MPPVIDDERCELCGTCYDICPQDVFAYDNKAPTRVTYPDECWYCGACVLDCPAEAIRLELPLQMHIVPSPALYASSETHDPVALKKAAVFSRSVIEDKSGDS